VRKAARENLKAGADFKVAGGGSPYDKMTDTQFTVEETRVAVEKAKARGKWVAAYAMSTQGVKNALELLVDQCGFTPLEALRAATVVAADAVGLSYKVGALEVGKYADIVIVEGNPLDDIKVLQDTSRLKMAFRPGNQVRFASEPFLDPLRFFYLEARAMRSCSFFFFIA